MRSPQFSQNRQVIERRQQGVPTAARQKLEGRSQKSEGLPLNCSLQMTQDYL